MAKSPKSEAGTPTERAGSPPTELYETSDIRFVMREIGSLTSTVNRLVEDVKDLAAEVKNVTAAAGRVERSVDRYRTAGIVIVTLFAVFAPIVGGIFWWAVGERINAVLKQPPPAAGAPAPTQPTGP